MVDHRDRGMEHPIMVIRARVQALMNDTGSDKKVLCIERRWFALFFLSLLVK